MGSRCLGPLGIEASDAVSVAEGASEVTLRGSAWPEAPRQLLLAGGGSGSRAIIVRLELEAASTGRLRLSPRVEALCQLLLGRRLGPPR